MNKNKALMAQARRVDPAPADKFKDLARTPEGQETLELILQVARRAPRSASPTRAIVESPITGGPQRTRRRLRAVAGRAAVVATAVAVVIAITTVGTSERPTPNGNPAWDAKLISIAEHSPRLLLPTEDWGVTRADELSAKIGEMTFENGRDCTLLPLKEGCYWMSLFWRPADTHASYFEDRKRGADASSKITIDGHDAVVFEFRNTAVGTTFQAMWLEGQHSLELRSDVVPTLDEFVVIASTLHAVDVDTWLSAMPESVVKPDARDEAIDRIVADIPIPDNLDLEELRNSQNVREDFALKDQVVETVVCGWIHQWIDGKQTHNGAVVSEAVGAMRGARDWAAMKGYGGASYVIDVADAMATEAPLDPNSSLPTGVGYQRHIGCPEG